MKVAVREYKKLSPFMSLFKADNALGKTILKILGKKYFDNTDLYILEKQGFKIINKTHI